MGDALHYGKALLTLCFWTIELPHRIEDKNIAGVTATGCVYQAPWCAARIRVSSRTLYGVSIYLNVVVSLSVFLKAVVGLNTERADASTHVFSFVVNRM